VDPVVGRDQELALVREFAGGLRDGPRALLLEGEAGIGKTAVWRAALSEAEAAGCRVLRCVAEQAEARLAFVGLVDLAGAVADELLPALPGAQREALEVALVRRAYPLRRAPDPAAVGAGVRSLLVAASRPPTSTSARPAGVATPRPTPSSSTAASARTASRSPGPARRSWWPASRP
jgi:hypothetical protein